MRDATRRSLVASFDWRPSIFVARAPSSLAITLMLDGEAQNRKEAHRTEGAEVTMGHVRVVGSRTTRRWRERSRETWPSVSHLAEGKAVRSQSPRTSEEAA